MAHDNKPIKYSTVIVENPTVTFVAPPKGPTTTVPKPKAEPTCPASKNCIEVSYMLSAPSAGHAPLPSSVKIAINRALLAANVKPKCEEAQWSHKFNMLYLQFDCNPKQEVLEAISPIIHGWATNGGHTVHIRKQHPISQLFIYTVPLKDANSTLWTPQSLWSALQESNEYWQGLTVETYPNILKPSAIDQAHTTTTVSFYPTFIT